MILTLFLIVGLASALVAVAYATWYNGLVAARQEVTDAWATVDVELERRHALIPGLVDAVRATAAHERQLLTDLIEADRRAAAADHTAADRSEPEADLGAAARAVIALREAYPALNSQQNFLALQAELSTTEDRISAARRFHNIQVAEFNRRTEAFPSNVVANRHGMAPAVYFGVN